MSKLLVKVLWLKAFDRWNNFPRTIAIVRKLNLYFLDILFYTEDSAKALNSILFYGSNVIIGFIVCVYSKKIQNRYFYEMVLKRRFWILESYTVKYFRRWYFYKRLEWFVRKRYWDGCLGDIKGFVEVFRTWDRMVILDLDYY